jgi:hypothetical protein
MNTQSPTIVQRLWNYCNVLRDDGMPYGDYFKWRLCAALDGGCEMADDLASVVHK